MTATEAGGSTPAPAAVRHATHTDATSIATLCSQLGYPTEASAIERRLARLLDHPEHGVWVAVRDGQTLGWLHASVTRALEYEPCAEILGLVVDEAARSGGVGAALVVAAEHWASALGLPEMRVRSRDSRERAHAFYRRCGYAEWKRQLVFRKTLPQGSL